MFVNLTRYGVKRLVNGSNVSFDLSDIDNLKLKMNDLIDEYALKFTSKEELDEFIGIFTGSRNNI
jgi:hypothetical protein